MTQALAMTRSSPCVIASAMATVLLSACVSMSGLGGESKYACAAPEGVTCQSVSGTYANAVRDSAAAPRLAASANTSPSAEHSSQPSRSSQPPKPAQPTPLGTDGTDEQVPGPRAANRRDAEPRTDAAEAELARHRPTAFPPDALRDPPRILRLWTKAWEDADGDLWDQGFVYVQVSSGSWRIDHVRQSARQRAASVHPPRVGASASKTGVGTGPGSAQSPNADEYSSGRPQVAPFPTIGPTLPLATRAAIRPPADRSSDMSSDRAVDRPSDNSQ